MKCTGTISKEFTDPLKPTQTSPGIYKPQCKNSSQI